MRDATRRTFVCSRDYEERHAGERTEYNTQRLSPASHRFTIASGVTETTEATGLADADGPYDSADAIHDAQIDARAPTFSSAAGE